MPIAIPTHPIDFTTNKSSNRITGEAHPLSVGSFRTVIPNYGAYYTKSLIVRNVATGNKLTAEVDYVAILYYEDPSVRSGFEVCAGILITDSDIDEVEIDYQAVGGEFESVTPILVDLIDQFDIDEPQEVQWGSLVGVPDAFPPSPHLHKASDLYGFEDVVYQLGEIRQAVLEGDLAKFEQLRTDFGIAIDNAKDWTSDQIAIAKNSVLDTLDVHKDSQDHDHRYPLKMLHLADMDSPKMRDNLNVYSQDEIDSFLDTLASEDKVPNWDAAYDRSIVGTSMSGDGNSALSVTLDRQDGGTYNFSTDLSHNHDSRYYTESEIDTKISNTETYADTQAANAESNANTYTDNATSNSGNWNTAYDRSPTSLSFSGSGGATATITLTRQGLTNLTATANLSHIHDDRYYREGEVDTLISNTESYALTQANNAESSANTYTDNATANSGNWDTAYNRSPTNVSLSGTGDGSLTIVLSRENSGSISNATNLAHNHSGDHLQPSQFTTGGTLHLNHGEGLSFVDGGSYTSANGRTNNDSRLIRIEDGNTVEPDGPLVIGGYGSTNTFTEYLYIDKNNVDINNDLTVGGNISGNNFNNSNWDMAYDRSVTGVTVSGDGNSSITVTVNRLNLNNVSNSTNTSHNHNELVTNVSGNGNGVLTLTRMGSDLSTNLAHSHGYADLPISSTDTSNWDTAYNRSVTNVSGSGNGTLTIHRQGGNTTTNLSHNHDSRYVRRDTETEFDVGRGPVYVENHGDDNASGAGITLLTSNNPGNGNPNNATVGSIFSVRSSGNALRFAVGQSITTSGDNSLYEGLERVATRSYADALDGLVTNVNGSGNGSITIVRNGTNVSTNLAHTHGYADLPISSTDTDNWNDAHSAYPTSVSVSGSGNGSLSVTVNRNSWSNISGSTNLSHSHNEFVTNISGDGNSSITLTRNGTNLSTSTSHNHSGDTLYPDIINLNNNEQGDHNSDGDVYFDSSAGLYVKASSVGGDQTGGNLLWSSGNVTVNDGISVSYGGEDEPTLSLPRKDNWDTAYDRSVIGISGSGNGTFNLTLQTLTLSTSLSHTHGYADLPIGSTDVSNWNYAFNFSVTGVSGGGNSSITISRNNVAGLTVDTSHTHGYADLPISSNDVSNWDTAYDRSVTGVGFSGSGNGLLTVTVNRLNQTNLSASVDTSHTHGYGDLPMSSIDVDKWNDGYWRSPTGVSVIGSGDGTLTVTVIRETSSSVSGSTDLSHVHLSTELADHWSQVVILGGDFDTGDAVQCERIGNWVTITATSVLGHDANSDAIANTAIPSQFRPTNDVQNTYTTSGIFGTIRVTAAGIISTSYYDGNFNNVNRNDTQFPPTITYLIT